MIIGIDPGLTGAIAILGEDGLLKSVHDMPTMMTGTGKGKVKNKVNCYKLAEIITDALDDRRMVEPVEVFLEKVSSMPGQGVAGVFSLGKSAGAVEGVVGALGIILHEVTPQKWKKGAGLIGSEKDAARTLAQQLYPDAPLARKKDIGRADAILIARHGFKVVR